jgi:putative transposase
VTDLVPGQSGGGKGKGRLPEPVERIIRELLQKRFLTKQKRSLAAFHREVAQACKAQSCECRRATPWPCGSPALTRARSSAAGKARMPPVTCKVWVAFRRDRAAGAGADRPHGHRPDRGRRARPATDWPPVPDPRHRRVHRCVLGMVVTLEAPSAVSVGLCLVHAACDKRPWLEGLNVEMDWPMSGKPRLLYLDNAAEFKSEALRRGCEQHGIRLDYRPLASRTMAASWNGSSARRCR